MVSSVAGPPEMSGRLAWVMCFAKTFLLHRILYRIFRPNANPVLREGTL
jgi:hypothetical protein